MAELSAKLPPRGGSDIMEEGLRKVVNESVEPVAKVSQQVAAKPAQPQPENKKLQEQKDAKPSPADTKKIEALRQENMKRIAGMAGATGDENATGTAQRAAGPSDSYGGRIRARIKPNITFTEDVASNASADVEVRCAPDGTIVGKKLIKSSGNAAWDNAVLKAIDKTEVLPRDTDGRVHSPLVISFRPKD
jgi:colicin import membrane protein